MKFITQLLTPFAVLAFVFLFSCSGERYATKTIEGDYTCSAQSACNSYNGLIDIEVKIEKIENGILDVSMNGIYRIDFEGVRAEFEDCDNLETSDNEAESVYCFLIDDNLLDSGDSLINSYISLTKYKQPQGTQYYYLNTEIFRLDLMVGKNSSYCNIVLSDTSIYTTNETPSGP